MTTTDADRERAREIMQRCVDEGYTPEPLAEALAAMRAETLEQAAKSANDTATNIRQLSKKFVANTAMQEMAAIRAEALEEFSKYLRALIATPAETEKK